MPINIRRDNLSVVWLKNTLLYSDVKKQDITSKQNTDTLHGCVEKNKSKERNIFCTTPFK